MHKNFKKRLLSAGLCLSLTMSIVQLCNPASAVYTAETKKIETSLIPDENSIDNSGLEKKKWKWDENENAYVSLNTGSNNTESVITIPLTVKNFATLQFDWKVSGRAGYYYLKYTLTDADNNIVKTQSRSGEESDYTTTKINLNAGVYTLKFSYKGNASGAYGNDKGYVKNLKLITYFGVTEMPKTMFATPTDLKNNSLFSLAKENYINIGRIALGFRYKTTKFYDSNWTDDNVRIEDGNQALISLVVGTDADCGLVLYTEQPVISANALDEASNSLFQNTNYEQIWNGEHDGKYPSGQEPADSKVSANHYGVSNLRKQLQELHLGPMFTSSEKQILRRSVISTLDSKNDILFTTSDWFYAPLSPNNSYGASATAIAVGEKDNLMIDKAFWGGLSWHRSPPPNSDSDYALFAQPGGFVDGFTVTDNLPACAFAFKINLDSVRFASAASDAYVNLSNNVAAFVPVDPDAPMRLRVSGSSELADANIIASGATLTYSAPAGSNVVAIVTDYTGKTYQFVQKIDANTENEVLNLSSIEGFPVNVAAGKAWIEKDFDEENCQLICATEAIDISAQGNVLGTVVSDSSNNLKINNDIKKQNANVKENPSSDLNILSTTVQLNNQPQRILVRSPRESLLDGATLSVKIVPNNKNLDQQNFKDETPVHYEINLLDLDGKVLDQPIGDDVELLFENINGLSRSKLNAMLPQLDDRTSSNEKQVDIDGTQYTVVRAADILAPYLNITSEEKQSKSNSSSNDLYNSENTPQEFSINKKVVDGNVKTSDNLSHLIVVALGLIMAFALGIILKLKSRKENFEK